jgi:small subunit ribosomal protein S20e
METTDKKLQNEENVDQTRHHLRIILKSQEVKNLEYVSSTIVSLAKEGAFDVKGPKYMPNKILKITTRRSPCGNGKKNLFYSRYQYLR